MPGTVGTTIAFATTENKEDVPLILWRAQLAILNSVHPLSHFVMMDEALFENHPVTVKFSHNTVMLKIIWADINVTFIDLPGIIANIEV